MSNSNNNTNDNNIINEVKALNRAAKGVKEADFGKIKEITIHYILAQKVENKDKFYLPRALLKDFNENELRFAITEQEANTKYKRDNPPSMEEYEIFYKKNSNKHLKNNKKKQDNTKNTNPMKKSASKYKNDKDKNELDLIPQKQLNNSSNRKKKLRKNVILEDNLDKNIIKISDIENKDEKKIEEREQAIQKINLITELQAEEKARIIIQQAEEKAKQDAEQRAQEIKEEIEKRARIEAEQRAQEIKEEIEKRARIEAEQRAQEIKEEIEKRARIEAEQRAQEIKEEIEKNKQNSNTNIIIKNNNETNNNMVEMNNQEEMFDPFFTSIEIWQNYSTYWINKIKEIFPSVTDLSKYLEIAKEKEWKNNSIYQWFGTNTT